MSPGIENNDSEHMSQIVENARPQKKEGKVYLKFTSSQSEPDYMGIFMEGGGQINAAATQWHTDFAMTGSTETTVTEIGRGELKEVAIEIPQDEWQETEMLLPDGKSMQVVALPATTRLNISTSRIGAAINGTLVSSVSGQGSEYLKRVLRHSGHSQVGLVYSSWLAHAANVGISETRIVRIMDDGSEQVQNIVFNGRASEDTLKLSEAAKIVNMYVQAAWDFRQHVVYQPSPPLTKTVFKEIVGIDAQGYSLVHDIVERGAPMSLETLDSLFEAGIKTDCCHDSKEYDTFIAATAQPGIMAAGEARTVASAANLVVNFLMAYRADGRNLVAATGADFAPAESWLRQDMRTPIEANDCDGSALLAVGILRAASNLQATKDNYEKYRHLMSVKNAVSTYYSIAIGIVGASAAEATSADGDHTNVAGHAIAILMPNIALLRGLEKATSMKIGKTGQFVCEDEKTRESLATARFDALFPKDVVDKLNSPEQGKLRNWKIAREEFKYVVPLGIDGTTPMTPIIWVENPVVRRNAEADCKNDDIALAKVSPNVFRSVKVLHVGSSDTENTHRFYRDIVEITFPRSHPLYQSTKLRDMKSAASQYVLSRPQPSDAIQTAGAKPKDLVLEDYLVVPLVSLDTSTSSLLDFASSVAEKDVIPPRPQGPMQLNEFQTKSLEKSMTEIKKMGQEINKGGVGVDGSHAVQYVVAFSTLVHNPTGVMHFCKKLRDVATDACVDAVPIKGLAQSSDGKEVGEFISINAYIPV